MVRGARLGEGRRCVRVPSCSVCVCVRLSVYFLFPVVAVRSTGPAVRGVCCCVLVLWLVRIKSSLVRGLVALRSLSESVVLSCSLSSCLLSCCCTPHRRRLCLRPVPAAVQLQPPTVSLSRLPSLYRTLSFTPYPALSFATAAYPSSRCRKKEIVAPRQQEERESKVGRVTIPAQAKLR